MQNPEHAKEFNAPEFSDEGHPIPDHQGIEGPRTLLIDHRDIVFEDDIVYMTGHAFYNCVFKRCTLVFKGFPGPMLVGCSFGGCAIHIDCVLHEKTVGLGYLAMIAALAHGLPSLEMSQPTEPRGESSGGPDPSTSPPLGGEPPLGGNEEGTADLNAG